MNDAKFSCPACNRSTLKQTGIEKYECSYCKEEVTAVGAVRDHLELLVDSELPCSWIAERLLGGNNG